MLNTLFCFQIKVMKYCLLASILLFAQLGHSQTNPTLSTDLLGRWINQTHGYAMVLQFHDQKNGTFDGVNFNYQLKNTETLVLYINGAPTNYHYQLLSNQFTLSGGELDGALVFKKEAKQSVDKMTSETLQTENTAKPNAIIGRWKGNGELIEFRSDGICVFQNEEIRYRLFENQILLDLAQQTIAMNYTLRENDLRLELNKQKFSYRREGVEVRKPVDRHPTALTGRWCYINAQMSSSAGTTEACLTLYANGQYTYATEKSTNTNAILFWGGSNVQEDDSGSWWYAGEKIHYQSKQTGKTGSYQLEKRNHPENKKPMLVFDGSTYVAQYQKAAW